MNVLCHVCCAPCYIGPFAALRAEGVDVIGYFYNPNIHPLLEFRRRLKALKMFQQRGGGRLIYEEDYGLKEYLARVVGRDFGLEGEITLSDPRCRECCALRLRRAAAMAVERGCDTLTTSMLASKHMNHDLVRAAGEEAAAEHGLRFLYRDFRPLGAAARRTAREMGLYLQNYCGCIFSEYERFCDTNEELYDEPAARPNGD